MGVSDIWLSWSNVNCAKKTRQQRWEFYSEAPPFCKGGVRRTTAADGNEVDLPEHETPQKFLSSASSPSDLAQPT